MDTTQIIHLIIDTSILRAEPYYKKEEYKSLEILVNKGILKIYLPYIVENEYVEQLKEPYLKKFNSIKDSLKDLKKRHSTNTEEVASIEESIAITESNTVKNVLEDFETNFCTKLGIEKLDIGPHHAKEVFSKYFKGFTPFKNKKSRDDIPDTFIFECVRDIKSKESNTVVLVGDGELSNACKKINTTIFKSLEDFIKHNEIQNILTEHIQFSNFIDYLKSNNSIENFLEYHHIKELENITIRNHQIPSDDNSAQITGIYTPENIKCDFAKLVHYGNKKIGVPVTFDIEVTAQLFVFKSDYYAEDYGFSSPEDWNDHYYSVESEYLLNVESTVIIDMSQIDFSVSDIDFDEILDEITMSLNAISDIEVAEKVAKKSKNEDIKCKCKQCGKVEHIPCGDLDWECIESEERGMGAENHYSAIYEFTCDCGNNITLEFDTWEYPVGVVNYCDATLKGCEIDKKCCYEFNKEPQRNWFY